MTLAEMKSLPGGAMIGMRVDAVLKTYGLPAAILASGDQRNRAVPAVWQGTEMRLSRGGWDLIYRASAMTLARPKQGWLNPRPAMPETLSGISGLTVVANGGVGFVRIDRAMHKTTYTVPNDQFLAHKVISAQGRFNVPVPIRNIVNQTENKCVAIAGVNKIRCWVLVEENEMPLAVYAVDLGLSKTGSEATGYTISGDEVDFVHHKYAEHYQHWMDLISD